MEKFFMDAELHLTAKDTRSTESLPPALPVAAPLADAAMSSPPRLSAEEIAVEIDSALVGDAARRAGQGELLLDAGKLRSIFDKFEPQQLIEAAAALKRQFGYDLERALRLLPPAESIEFSRRYKAMSRVAHSAAPADTGISLVEEQYYPAQILTALLDCFDRLEALNPPRTPIIERLHTLRDRVSRVEFAGVLAHHTADPSAVKQALAALSDEQKRAILIDLTDRLEHETSFFSFPDGNLVAKWLRTGYDAPPLCRWDSTRIVFEEDPTPGPPASRVTTIPGHFPTPQEILESLAVLGRLPSQLGDLADARWSSQVYRSPRRHFPLLMGVAGGLLMSSLALLADQPPGVADSVFPAFLFYFLTRVHEVRRCKSSLAGYVSAGIISRCRDMSLPVATDYRQIAMARAFAAMREFGVAPRDVEVESAIMTLQALSLLDVPAASVIDTLRKDSFDPAKGTFPGLSALLAKRRAEIGLPDELFGLALHTLDIGGRLVRLWDQMMAQRFAMRALELEPAAST